MNNPQTHYRARFSVERTVQSKADHVFRTTLGFFGSWLQSHSAAIETGDQIFKMWFHQGGRFVLGPGAIAEVRIENYDAETRSPEYWVMRFEHPDSQYRFRIWRTDIALHIEDKDHAEFAVTVTRYLRDNYMGEEPEIPESSVPKFVKEILNARTLTCRINQVRLQPTASYLSPTDCHALHYYLTSLDRTVPVVLINIKDRGHVISEDELQSLVIGSGMVFFYDDVSVHEALVKKWGNDAPHYQCGPDSIRVYLPGLSTARLSDWRSHRYINLAKYEDIGDQLIRTLTQSIFRISYNNVQDLQVSDFESLYQYQQKQRLAKLRAAATGNTSRTEDDRLYFEALEEENTNVNAKSRALQSELQTAKEDIQFMEEELNEKQEQLRVSQEQFNGFSLTESQYRKNLANQEDKRKYCRMMPTTLVDDLRQVANLYSDKIVVLDAAYASAESAAFQFIPEAHEVLFEIANGLHELYFLKGSKDIIGDSALIGLDITLSESSMTRNDKKLMDLRKREYEGEQHDFSPHAKLQKGGIDLRVHFIPDHARRLIVIGHCGDHLRTAGTARRKNG